jgi:hypothetical protein
VKLKLQEFSPFDQEVALDQGSIDIGFTRTLTAKRSKTPFTAILLLRTVPCGLAFIEKDNDEAGAHCGSRQRAVRAVLS